MPDGRHNRRTYAEEERNAALYLIREVGVTEASRRLGISVGTLHDWKVQTKAFAYSPFVGRGRSLSDRERRRLLAQLVHEQELELRLIGRCSYRHDPKGSPKLIESLDVLLDRAGTVQRHLLEWLDPTFDEVAERLAA